MYSIMAMRQRATTDGFVKVDLRISKTSLSSR